MKLPHWIALSTFLASGILLWNLKEIIIQIFAAVVLALALCTLVEKIRSIIPIRRTFALFICLGSLLTVFTLILILVLPPFAKEFQELILQLPKAARILWDLATTSFDNISELFYGETEKRNWEEIFFPYGFNPLPDSNSLANGVADGIKKILGFASNLGFGLVQIIFVLVVSLMIALQPKSYFEAAILIVPSFYRRRARTILHKCGIALTEWMFGVFISSICVAILAGLCLSILGVKFVIANALITGVLNIIPNLGPTISTIFPLSVAILDAPWKALAVLGSYIFIQNLESYVITPSIMQHQVKLLPGLTLSAQFIFTIIFGPIGLLLALPLTVVMQVAIREVLIEDLLDNWKNNRINNLRKLE